MRKDESFEGKRNVRGEKKETMMHRGERGSMTLNLSIGLGIGMDFEYFSYLTCIFYFVLFSRLCLSILDIDNLAELRKFGVSIIYMCMDFWYRNMKGKGRHV